MRTWMACVVACWALGCNENKYEKILAKDAAPPPVLPSATASAAPAPKKKAAIECPTDGSVVFHDAKLEAEIRRKLAKDAGPITSADLGKVRSVNLAEAKVDELDPCIFPKLTGMKDLFLGPGELDDLSPLSSLVQMMTLRAAINQVSDLKPLSKLVKMDRLDLARTAIIDLTPLEGMVNLTELQLDNTNVRDLTPLAKCKALETLHIENTPVRSLLPLRELTKLKSIYIAGTAIDDTNVLAPAMARGLKIVQK